jgi:hypothetical protein
MHGAGLTGKKQVKINYAGKKETRNGYPDKN